MAGIYLHIPFCKQACHYCNFHFTTSLRYKDDLVQALLEEIKMEQEYLQGEPIETIYFGGGTPSLLTIDDCRLLVEGIYKHYTVVPGAEITLEANPDDINREKLHHWKQLGVNRLSIGVQSFFEEELRWMNRAHDAGHARQCIEWSLAEGFHNFSIDLIYGSPLLTDAMWEQNVKTALDYGITHLSCYALTVEEKTPLHKQINALKKEDVDADKQARQFLQLMQWLRGAGYEHYEVSNFAKPGYRSRHNSSYWTGTKYLGLGPSAHSYNGTERRWNIANNNVYIKGITTHRPAHETEVLSPGDRLNEYIMISLRTMEGMNLEKVGDRERERIERLLTFYVNDGLVIVQHNTARLTDEGMLMADGIASRLFTV